MARREAHLSKKAVSVTDITSLLMIRHCLPRLQESSTHSVGTSIQHQWSPVISLLIKCSQGAATGLVLKKFQ